MESAARASVFALIRFFVADHSSPTSSFAHRLKRRKKEKLKELLCLNRLLWPNHRLGYFRKYRHRPVLETEGTESYKEKLLYGIFIELFCHRADSKCLRKRSSLQYWLSIKQNFWAVNAKFRCENQLSIGCVSFSFVGLAFLFLLLSASSRRLGITFRACTVCLLYL